MPLTGRDASHIILHAMIDRWQAQSARALEAHATSQALDTAEKEYRELIDLAVERLVSGQTLCPDLSTWRQTRQAIQVLANPTTEVTPHDTQLGERLEHAREVLDRATKAGQNANRQMREAQEAAERALYKDPAWIALDKQRSQLFDNKRLLVAEHDAIKKQATKAKNRLMSQHRTATLLEGKRLGIFDQILSTLAGDRRAIEAYRKDEAVIADMATRITATGEVLFARENEANNYKSEKIWQDPGVRCASIRESGAWRAQNEAKEQVRVLEIARVDLEREGDRNKQEQGRAKRMIASQVEAHMDLDWGDVHRPAQLAARKKVTEAREVHHQAVQDMTIARLLWSQTHAINSQFIDGGMDWAETVTIEEEALRALLSHPNGLETLRENMEGIIGPRWKEEDKPGKRPRNGGMSM